MFNRIMARFAKKKKESRIHARKPGLSRPKEIPKLESPIDPIPESKVNIMTNNNEKAKKKAPSVPTIDRDKEAEK